jgi:hypothetical protein
MPDGAVTAANGRRLQAAKDTKLTKEKQAVGQEGRSGTDLVLSSLQICAAGS